MGQRQIERPSSLADVEREDGAASDRYGAGGVTDETTTARVAVHTTIGAEGIVSYRPAGQHKTRSGTDILDFKRREAIGASPVAGWAASTHRDLKLQGGTGIDHIQIERDVLK